MGSRRKSTRKADVKPKEKPASTRRRGGALVINSDSDSSNNESNSEGESQIIGSEFLQPGTPPSTARQKKDPTAGKYKTKKEEKKDGFLLSYDFETKQEMDEREMRNSILLYLWALQAKARPARKCDLIKYAINKQSRDFPDAIVAVEEGLHKDFGLRLVGMKTGATSDSIVGCGILEATSFIIVSKVRQYVAAVTKAQDSKAKIYMEAGLLVILACTYMLDRSVDEDTIWSMFQTLEFANIICKKREDFRRYLKAEYVDSLYLTKCEIKNNDESVIRYGWGFRADQEYNKYAVLKFVSDTFSKSPEDFPTQFSKISRKEVALLDKEFDSMKRNDANDDADADDPSSDGTSQKLRRKKRRAPMEVVEDEDADKPDEDADKPDKENDGNGGDDDDDDE